MKKIQSCAVKEGTFVERSRNKAIDKKSILCYSENTNYVTVDAFGCDQSCGLSVRRIRMQELLSS